MRKKLYDFINQENKSSKTDEIYDLFMMFVIFISLIPLAFKTQYKVFDYIEIVSTIIFLIDYFIRLATADYYLQKGIYSFIKYPFTPMAIIDLVSILPSIIIMNPSFRLLKVFRLLRSFRVFRVFKTFRYSKSIILIINVYHKTKDSLLTVLGIAIVYVLVSALLILNVEPDTFNNYFDAIYWATVSLTTMGYGDIYPVSTIGRIITMSSSFFGIAIIALPAGIITAGMMDEIEGKEKNKDD